MSSIGEQQVMLQSRVDDLERDNKELHEEVKLLRAWLKEDVSNLDHLRDTFNGNVDQENKARVARMTANGACGTEQVNFPGGGWTIRNKECTLKDLK